MMLVFLCHDDSYQVTDIIKIPYQGVFEFYKDCREVGMKETYVLCGINRGIILLKNYEHNTAEGKYESMVFTISDKFSLCKSFRTWAKLAYHLSYQRYKEGKNGLDLRKDYVLYYQAIKKAIGDGTLKF